MVSFAPMNILIQFVHPHPRHSRVNRRLLEAVADLDGVAVNDLFELYPDFYIDVVREQELLLTADLVVFQHPFYWYSAPAMLKQWLDVVFSYGFAFGSEGRALHGKRLLSAVSTGHGAEAYRADGYDRFTMRELLRPFEQTAFHCGMTYEKPFVVHGARRMSDDELQRHGEAYRRLLTRQQKKGAAGEADG